MAKDEKVFQPKEKKVAPLVVSPEGQIQIHFGNVEIIKLKLLESINKNLLELVKLMKDVKEDK